MTATGTHAPADLLHRLAMDAAPQGMGIVDRDLRFVYVNAAFAATDGRPVAEHIGRPVADVLPDTGAVTAMTSVLAGGHDITDWVVNGSGAGPGGAARLETYRALRDANERIVGLLVVVQGIPEPRRTQTALDQERADGAVLAEITREVLDKTGPESIARAVLAVAVDSLDATCGAVYLREEPGDVLVLEAASGLAEEAAARIHSVPGDDVCALWQVLRTNQVITVADQAEAATYAPGTPVHAFLAGGAAMLVPIRTPRGPIGVFVIGCRSGALTEELVGRARTFANVAAASLARDRAYRSEREALLLLEAVLDQMPVGVIVADRSGTITSMNPAVRRIWRGEREARSLADYTAWPGFRPDGRLLAPEEWPLARSLLGGEAVVDEEIAIERFDGTPGTVAVSSSPIVGPDGSTIAAVAVISDVTHRRESRAAREAFLGVLAHELRTPLTSILGSARLLGRRSLDEALRDELRADVVAEAERMARVVENLLVVSRVERGLDLRADDPVLVQRVLPALVGSERAAWPGINVDLRVAASLPPVRGDDGLLEQVLRNLLSNAAKYAPGDVAIVAERRGDEVSIVVQDRGPGIDAAEAGSVFDLFYRSSRTRHAAPGAGIGLFVVRRLVEAMGGQVSLEPSETGCRFVITLARYQEAG